MEHKKWIWKRKKSEAAYEKGAAEKAYKQQDIDMSLKCLNNALISSISETKAKDDLLEKQTKAAQEAVSGWEKAKTEVENLRRQVNDGLHEKAVLEERLGKLDAELEESTQRYRGIEEERDKMAVDIAEKLSDANRKISLLTTEKENLIAVVKEKEKIVEDLNEAKLEVEENLKVEVDRLDLSEKFNSSLRYEVCMLEKEVQIRNEERDFNLKSVDVAQKRHIESAKTIAELEAECQKLRIMVRKRLPGPAALKGMKSQVEMIGTSNRTATSATQRLRSRDKENEQLKEEIRKINKELELVREMHAISSSKLRDIQKESSAESSGGGQRSGLHTHNESWASALISELDYFRNAKLTTASPSSKTSVSDLNFTNEFVEIEKPSKIDTTKPTESSDESKNPVWLKDILRVVLQAKCLTQKDVDVILEEVRSACVTLGHSSSSVICVNHSKPKLEEELCKLINLVEKIGQSSSGDEDDSGSSPPLTISGYFSRVFDWDCSEWRHVLQNFIQSCNDLLHLRISLQEFVSNTTNTLSFRMMHSRPSSFALSLQDASRTEEMLDIKTESDNHSNQSSKIDLLVHSETKKIPQTDDRLNRDHQQSDTEPILLLKSKSPLKFSSTKPEKVEISFYPETEECLQPQLLEQSRVANQDMDQIRKPQRTTLEMYAASEKLAECQETIINLGKQLKVLASRNALISTKVMSSTSKTIHGIALPLHDQTQTIHNDDKSEEQVPTPVTKEVICTTDPQKHPSIPFSKPHFSAHQGSSKTHQLTIGNLVAPIKLEERLNAIKGEKHGTSHALVQRRQKSNIGLWRKLFLRRKVKESKRFIAIAS